MIQLNQITKTLDNKGMKVNILNGISFAVDDKDILGVMGPSGCGKSTLLGIIGGLDDPTQGSVVIDNTDLYKLLKKERNDYRNRNIGMVFQNHNLIEELTCYENICLPMIFAKNNSADSMKKSAYELMEILDLKDKEKLYPYQLSGGEQQRTSVARALIRQPRLLLADEPTGSLDIKNAQRIMELFHQIVSVYNISVLMVTHDASIASSCHHIVKMLDGRIVE